MQHLAPLGGVYQAGTLSGNAVAMAAGLATLCTLEREDGWRRLEAIGQKLEDLLVPVLASAPYGATFVREGSLFWISLQDGAAPRSAEAIDAAAAARYRPLFHALLESGIALAPSAFEAGFLSLAHTTVHLERLRDALAAAFETASAKAGAT
jgi:glutamate-1-semialdehyde 2,1-aminomutase